MRYATTHSAAVSQARSLRIGRCARCHAPVLSDEDHFGDGAELVHGACGIQPTDRVRGGVVPGTAAAFLTRPPPAAASAHPIVPTEPTHAAGSRR